jgi:hypothetical protein
MSNYGITNPPSPSFLERQAQKDKEPRLVLRVQGILMSLEGHTAGEIANHSRPSVPLCGCSDGTFPAQGPCNAVG